MQETAQAAVKLCRINHTAGSGLTNTTDKLGEPGDRRFPGRTPHVQRHLISSVLTQQLSCCNLFCKDSSHQMCLTHFTLLLRVVKNTQPL